MEGATGPQGVPYGHLEQLLKDNLELAKANNRILRRMERNALIGFVAKAIIWLLVLGVPIFFFSSYIGPLMSAFHGEATSTVPGGVFGLPSAEQLQEIVNSYKAKQP